MKENWEEFWADYRNVPATESDHLFYQVGKTVGGEPISLEIFEYFIRDIISNLKLKQTDALLEMCCGNGLLTQPLASKVKQVYAFDFTQHLIETAQVRCNADNINYKVADAKKDFLSEFGIEIVPQKILMNDSLGYFDSAELKQVISKVLQDELKVYITGIPSDRLKWNFYNTPERKTRYEELQMSGQSYNDGMGKWWLDEELYNIADEFDLKLTLSNQPSYISNYRMNALFEKL